MTVSTSSLLATNLVVALALALAASAARAAVPVVDNPAIPPGGRSAIQPELVWKVGGESEADEEFFGVVRNSVVDETGVTYLLDEQLCEVRAFDASGGFVTSFGRQGEGPGEFMRPNGILLLPDASIGVLHGRPTRISRFSRAGEILGDVSIGDGSETFGFVMGAESAGGHLAMLRMVGSMGDKTIKQTTTLCAFGADGKIGTIYAQESREQPRSGGPGMRFAFDGSMVSSWTLGYDGSLYLARHEDRYEIEVYDPRGTHVRTIRRAFERQKRPKAELDRMRERQKQVAERFGGGGPSLDIGEFRNDIDQMIARPDGELWVRSSAGRPEKDGSLGVFDVFDANGRFTRQVEVKVDFDATADQFDLIDGRLLIYEEANGAMQNMRGGMGMVVISDEPEDGNEELQPLAITCYRLPGPKGR